MSAFALHYLYKGSRDFSRVAAVFFCFRYFFISIPPSRAARARSPRLVARGLLSSAQGVFEAAKLPQKRIEYRKQKRDNDVQGH